MFRFYKPRDVITIFHKPSSASSLRALALLNRVSTTASEAAADDTKEDATNTPRAEFDLNVTEDPPTTDQLRTLFEYAGPKGAGDIVKGAQNPDDAMKLFKQSADNFRRPVIVDWNNGRAVFGDNKSEILKLLNL